MTAVDWRPLAACAGVNPGVFYPNILEQRPRPRRTNQALALPLAVCRRCPVNTECRDWALTTRQAEGIWGGTLPAERAWLTHFAPLPPEADRSRCGTDAGYARHLRHGEPTCQPCRDAHTLSQSHRPHPAMRP